MNELTFLEAVIKINTPYGESGSEAEKDALASIAYLWQLDNAEWVMQREIDWQHLVKSAYHDVPKSERKLYELYFKRGDKLSYIPEQTLVFLTPYTNVKELKQVFNSQLLDTRGRENILSNYIFLNDDKTSLSWYQQHMMLAIKGLLGTQYHIIKEAVSPTSLTVISPEPTCWVSSFVNNTIKVLSRGNELGPFYQCIDYFISALPYATRDDREYIRLTKMLNLIDNQLEAGNVKGKELVFFQTLKARTRYSSGVGHW
jgi:hypothetical protein